MFLNPGCAAESALCIRIQGHSLTHAGWNSALVLSRSAPGCEQAAEISVSPSGKGTDFSSFKPLVSWCALPGETVFLPTLWIPNCDSMVVSLSSIRQGLAEVGDSLRLWFQKLLEASRSLQNLVTASEHLCAWFYLSWLPPHDATPQPCAP